MSRLGDFEVHPAADVFPLLEGEEFAALVADIKKNGLAEPVVLNHDETVLIDGRNRLRACEEAEADVVYRTLGSFYTEIQILDFIVSANIKRRQLNAGQRAIVAQTLVPLYAAAAKEAQKKHGGTAPGKPKGPVDESLVADPPQVIPEDQKSRTKAAEAAGASARLTQQAIALKRDAPDLWELVRTGKMAMDAADKERKRRLKNEPKPEPVNAAPKAKMLTLFTHDGVPVQYPEPKGKAKFNPTEGDGISWASWSWNPVTGCLHGCKYCYARAMSTKETFKAAFPVGFTPLFHPERLSAPMNTAVPQAATVDPALQRVFVCSMADLYGRWVPDSWIKQVHEACIASPQWQYLFLTKFPSRYVGMELPPTSWLGTSVDEQKRVRLAEEAFAQIDGVAVKWLSLEPLLEPLQFTDLSMFDWVVIGAQTETRQPTGTEPGFAPPFEWVARIVAQAREAGCKVHLKPNLLGQISGSSPGMTLPNEYPEPRML